MPFSAFNAVKVLAGEKKRRTTGRDREEMRFGEGATCGLTLANLDCQSVGRRGYPSPCGPLPAALMNLPRPRQTGCAFVYGGKGRGDSPAGKQTVSRAIVSKSRPLPFLPRCWQISVQTIQCQITGQRRESSQNTWVNSWRRRRLFFPLRLPPCLLGWTAATDPIHHSYAPLS